MPKRAALYIRVSSDEQARHGLSLGEQRADLLNYAKEHGYIVVGIYADEGVSARKAMSHRKELQRLLADVEKGLVDIIVIKCLDRWFRNIADFYKVKEKLDAYGVDWECTREQYNTTTPNGILMLNLKLSIAQNESDQTGERIRYVFAGKKERREVITGSVPIGLQVVDKHPVPDENAPAIQHIFRFVANGGSMHGAMVELYEKFGISVCYQTIHKMLKNRTYIGEMYGIPDYAPALIPHDVFQRVQERITRNAKHTPSGRIYLFSGLIVCPECGRRFSGIKGAPNIHGEYKSFQYRCSSNMGKRVSGCHYTRSIFEKKMEAYLLENIQQLIRNHIVTLEQHRARQKKECPEIKIEALKAKLSRLEDIYLEGMIDKSKYIASYKAISQELSELTASLDRSLSVPAAMVDVANDDNFLETYNSLTRENKQRFWKSIIDRITYYHPEGTRGKGIEIPFHVVFL
ncbi:MAG: recombinase family protein [Selenomonadaceae bacterium]|nr:recombinase family protein [Selenomonadaceae bacterium]